MDTSNVNTPAGQPFYLHRHLAWYVLAISMMLTIAFSLHRKSSIDSTLEHEFVFRCDEIGHRISSRLEDHARLLSGAAALFNASDSVSREEWRIFANSQKLGKQLPGVQALGFVPLISRSELPDHIQGMRKDGFPEYTVWPAGDRDFYVPVIYIEPFSGRNLQAIGYDAFSEPVRRDAMERARDTGAAALSGKIILVQEAGGNAQAGSVMVVPVYRTGTQSDTLEQRRAAIYGWVSSPCRMADLIEGTLNVAKLKADRIHLELFDGNNQVRQNQLYACCPAQCKSLRPCGRFTRTIPIDFNGHNWTLRMTVVNRGLFAAQYSELWLTLCGGTIISIILFALICTLQNTRIRAQRMAQDLTLDLQQSVERYQSLLQTAMDGFWLLDMQGHILECNETYRQMSGYSLQELLTLRITDLDGCESPAETAAHIVKITAQGEDRFVTRHRRKDGTLYDVEISAQYRPVEGGRMVAFIRDITERKKTEAELQKIQKLQSVGVLAGGIAHDFNNILMGLFGNISLAKNDIPPDHASFKPLEDAEKSMNRAIRLTKQLLTFSKGGEPIIESVDLGSVIEEVAQFDLSGSDVRLFHEQAPDLWRARVDKGQIQQVISNLTTNARQAMPNGGHLHIRLENETIKDSAMNGLCPGKYIRVTVQDEGGGISPAIIDRIFDPYFTTKQSGCGLGLATTHSIVVKHGGHIAVVSQLGKGTTFTLYLPASDVLDPVADKPADTSRGVVSPSTRILVMDDEEYIRMIVPRWVKELGCTTLAAADGCEAVKLYQQAMERGAPFDVLILDITIPGGMGGYEVLKEILAINPDAKAIVSSGYADSPMMSKYSFYGFMGVLPKPYTQSQLHEVLAQVLKAG